MPSQSSPIYEADISLDVSHREAYRRSVQQLRRYAAGQRNAGAIEKGGIGEEIIEIDVSVRGPQRETASVRLFMAMPSRYLIGFRGEGGTVFALREAKQDPHRFRKGLAAALEEEVVGLDLGVSHEELGTYNGPFDVGALHACHALSRYREGTDFKDIRRQLALLVCMLAEASRIPCVQGQCMDLYEGRLFYADKDLLGNYGSALELRSVQRDGQTLEDMAQLRASVVQRSKEILYALGRDTSEFGLGYVLTLLYAQGTHVDSKPFASLMARDINVQHAVAVLKRDAAKLVGGSENRLIVAQIRAIEKIAAMFRDQTVLRAAANLPSRPRSG